MTQESNTSWLKRLKTLGGFFWSTVVLGALSIIGLIANINGAFDPNSLFMKTASKYIPYLANCDDGKRSLHGIFYFSDRDPGEFPLKSIAIKGRSATCNYEIKNISRIGWGEYHYSVFTENCSVSEDVTYYLGDKELLVGDMPVERFICQKDANIDLTKI